MFDVHDIKYQPDQREWFRDSGIETKYGLIGSEMHMPRVVLAIRRGVFGGGREEKMRIKKMIKNMRLMVYPFNYFSFENE